MTDVSRASGWILIIAVLVAITVTVKSLSWKAPVIPPSPQPQTGLQCFRLGGDRDYCSCLDRIESARARAQRPKPAMPRFDDPAIRYALRHPERYPIINGDTLRCLTPRNSPADGVIAGAIERHRGEVHFHGPGGPRRT